MEKEKKERIREVDMWKRLISSMKRRIKRERERKRGDDDDILVIIPENRSKMPSGAVGVEATAAAETRLWARALDGSSGTALLMNKQ